MDKIELRIDKGTAVLTLKEGKTVKLEKVRAGVKEAGLTPKGKRAREERQDEDQ